VDSRDLHHSTALLKQASQTAGSRLEHSGVVSPAAATVDSGGAANRFRKRTAGSHHARQSRLVLDSARRFGGRLPRREKPKRVGVPTLGNGEKNEESKYLVCRDARAFELGVHVADDRVMDMFGAAVRAAHVLLRRVGAELVATPEEVGVSDTTITHPGEEHFLAAAEGTFMEHDRDTRNGSRSSKTRVCSSRITDEASTGWTG